MKKIKCEICDKSFSNENALEMHNKSKHYKNKGKYGNKIIYVGIAIVIILAIGLFFALRNNGSSASDSNAVQKITLSFENNYLPNTIEVKQGIPVEITLDSSVGGCYRAFTIPALGVSKISRSPSDTIKFTPTKAGIFRFQCGMNMGYGTIIVN